MLQSARSKKTLLSCVLLGAAASALAQGVIPPAPPASTASAATITVDFANKVGPYKPIYSWFGYDEANYTTMRNGKVLLRELRDLSPVPVYIRAHHLLTSGDGKAELKFSSTNVYTEDASGKPVYDFKILDGIFDEYKAAGVRPMVEFGFMPKDLAADLPNRKVPYQVHYPKSAISGASNNPPKDYAKWGELIRVITAHFVERYGKETVLQWYFEVWNEPDIDYWHSTPEDYWKLYDYAVAGVKSVLPTARVGGPATTSPSSEKAYNYLKGFLDHVASGKSLADGKSIPLDFISFHAKGKPTIVDSHVTMGIQHELADADRGFYLISQYPNYRSLPIILSEADPEGCAACSSRVNPANNYRNGTLYPAYTAAAFKALFELQDKHKVNLLSMLSWSFEFEDKDYFEGFRSLSTNGINKPVLNLFRMLGLMSGTRVATTSTASVPLEHPRQHRRSPGSRRRRHGRARRPQGDCAALELPRRRPARTSHAHIRQAQRPSHRREARPRPALSHRRDPQQRLHCVEGDGLAAATDNRAVRTAAGGRWLAVANLARMGRRRRRQARSRNRASPSKHLARNHHLVERADRA